jgi:single-strand DNA-binding protein
MNSINLIGRLTADPELKYTSKDKKAAVNFSVAYNASEEHVDFFNIVAYDKTAETICKYVKKGNQIGITGRLTTRTYEVESGKRTVTEIIANSITLIGSKD